jgi:hypothetical protein
LNTKPPPGNTASGIFGAAVAGCTLNPRRVEQSIKVGRKRNMGL